MKWQKKLNKTDIKHLKYATHNRPTLQTFKDNREAQHKLDPNGEVCFDCKRIAIKLGVES